MSFQSRKFVFTKNNPDKSPDEFLEHVLTWKKVRYVVFQLEIGKNSTPHYQGYIEFMTLQRASTLEKRHLMFFAVRKGSLEQAVNYVKKLETASPGTIREWGSPVTQGQRIDIETFRDNIKQGSRIKDVIDEYPREMALYPRFYRLCKSVYFDHYENMDKQVILCIGEPRTGKTCWARKLSKDYWINPIATQKWFDGYEQQEVAILDDYGLDGTVYRLVDLLRLLHTWTEVVPIKGGFTQWVPDTVVITTNYHPLQWYKLNSDIENDRISRWISYKALYKRFTKVLLFESPKKEPMVCKDIAAFFLDINCKFEHQIVPQSARDAYLTDLLITSEELDYSTSIEEEMELEMLFDGLDVDPPDDNLCQGPFFDPSYTYEDIPKGLQELAQEAIESQGKRYCIQRYMD